MADKGKLREAELIEELAQALYSAFWKGSPPIPTEVAVHLSATRHFSSEAPIDKAWLSAAKETLRQMEWARWKCAARLVETNEKGEVIIKDGQASLTGELTPLVQAPRDWKP